MRRPNGKRLRPRVTRSVTPVVVAEVGAQECAAAQAQARSKLEFDEIISDFTPGTRTAVLQGSCSPMLLVWIALICVSCGLLSLRWAWSSTRKDMLACISK